VARFAVLGDAASVCIAACGARSDLVDPGLDAAGSLGGFTGGPGQDSDAGDLGNTATKASTTESGGTGAVAPCQHGGVSIDIGSGASACDSPAGTWGEFCEKASTSTWDIYACGVEANGSVACWGDNRDGQGTPHTGAFTSVACGGTFSCGVRPNRRVAWWESVLVPAQD
jgi:hypothetical protein